MNYRIRYYCESVTGRRRSNQDNLVCAGRLNEGSGDFHGISGEAPALPHPLFGVFDGMGGMECGELASCTAARTALDRAPGEGLCELCRRASDEIFRISEEKGISAGSTAALLEFTQDGASACNVGDSRIYRFSGGRLTQLSKDHSAPETAGGTPKLYQYLGVCPQELIIEPYLVRTECRHGDIFLICSDGLTEKLPEQKLSELIAGTDYSHLGRLLVSTALDCGSRDNITVITCRVEGN